LVLTIAYTEETKRKLQAQSDRKEISNLNDKRVCNKKLRHWKKFLAF